MVTTSWTSNQFYLRFLNPYDPIMWLGDLYVSCPEPAPEPEPKPNYTLHDFLDICPEFYGYFDEDEPEKKTMGMMFMIFKNYATSLINYRLIGEDEYTFKILVSLLLGHHLEQAFARIKSQADEISMTPEKATEKKISYSFGLNTETNWDNTKYGHAFWELYKPYGRFRFFGISKR